MQLNHVRRAPLLAATVLLLGFLAGCGQSKVQLGWIASNRPGHSEASYTKFSGSEVRTIRANAGGTLVIKYLTTVNKGTLDISVEGPADEPLWAVSLASDAEDTVALPLEQDGRYTIFVHGDGTGGSFDLSWEVE